LNSFECVCDIVRGALENRICVVGTGADESMSNKRHSVIVETVSDVSESLIYLFIEPVHALQMVNT
jgi:hypothetical protein